MRIPSGIAWPAEKDLACNRITQCMAHLMVLDVVLQPLPDAARVQDVAQVQEAELHRHWQWVSAKWGVPVGAHASATGRVLQKPSCFNSTAHAVLGVRVLALWRFFSLCRELGEPPSIAAPVLIKTQKERRKKGLHLPRGCRASPCGPAIAAPARPWA